MPHTPLTQEEFDHRLRRLSHATNTEVAIQIEEGLSNKYRALLSQVEELRAANRWIPVTERLPEDGLNVLLVNAAEHRPCFVGSKWKDSFMDDDTGMWAVTDGYITHWCPLPTPPITGGSRT